MENNQKLNNNLNKQNINNNFNNINFANNSDPNIQRNREFNVNSETVVSFMIEKMISLAITDSLRNEIDAKIPTKCFTYITDMVNNYIKIEYLPYDRDDKYILIPNKKKAIKNFLNSNKNLNNLNNMNIVINNNNIENEQNISNSQNNFLNKSISNNEIINNINVDSSLEEEENKKIINEVSIENEFLRTNDNQSNINLEDNIGYFFDNNFFGINDWTICDEPVSAKIDRSATSMIRTIKPVKEASKEKDDDKQSNKNSDGAGKNRHKHKSTKLLNENEEIEKPHTVQKEEIHQYRLTNIEEFLEDPIIRKVRLEKEMQLKKEEEEKKIKRIQEKEIIEKNNEMLKKMKDNQNKHFTTDVNGDILLIKGTGIDRLQGEFFFPKLNVLDKATIQPPNLITTTQKTTDKKDQPPSRERIPSSKSKLYQKLPTSNKTIGIFESSSYNNANFANFGNFINSNSNNNNNTNNNISNNNNYNNNANSEKEKISILPAGSSFDLIAPEVGVTIIEGDKQKSGGKDYLRHFKKYSKYDYTQLVRDTMNANMTQSGLSNKNTNGAKNTILPDGSISKFGDYNSLRMNNTVSNFGFSKEISEEALYDMENFKDDNFKSGIKLNTKYGTSLRTAIEKLDLIPEFEESEMDTTKDNKKINNTNLFKNSEPNKTAYNKKRERIILSDKKSEEDLNEINKFNNAIMKNSNWGNSVKQNHTEENAKNLQFHKPDQKEIEREIGKSIYNTKLPRARLFTKIKDPGSNSFNKIANKTAFGATGNTKFFGDTTIYNNAFNKTAYNDKTLMKKK